LSGARRELAETALRQRAALEEADLLRGLVASLPWPVWAQRADGSLAYVNPAYAHAVDAKDSADALRRGLDLLDSGDRDAMHARFMQDQPFMARLPVVVGGNKRMLDVHAIRLTSGSAGIAIDATEAADMSMAIGRMAEAHRRTLNQLATGVAVFDAQQRLVFYNDSYRQVWNLDAAFLDSNPRDSAVLDRLRAARQLPEEQDFRQWKARLHQAYQSVEAREDTWHLPDGRTLRMVTTPNTEGGVTYLFDDVTERLDLARRFDALIRVQRETLDNLAEGVAVFGGNGRIQLFNPAFARLWKLDAEALTQQPHVEEVQRWCVPLFDDSLTWLALRGVITSIDNRASLALRLDRKDGSLLDCISLPLPDGATLVTFQDITDTENVERALRERNEALEAADKVKIDFVHHVSYELRSPLTTLIGFAHFLNDPATGALNDRQREYLSYITTSTNTLLAIINNILDLASIDAGAMTLTLGDVDARQAIAAAAEGIQDRLVTDSIHLDVLVASDIGNFVADERRVIQVLYNLLANAAGFSPHGAAITVTAQRTADAVVFAVTDHGPGIPVEAQNKVFDWFESNSNGSRHRGAGLGLSLVRSFMELHGGTVRVDSAAGQGTTVTCSFPVDQAAHRVAAQ
jgi:signal transduction histidine kinase